MTAPPRPEFLSVTALGELGRAAEVAGFSAAYLTDHPAPAQAWRESGGHDALDPFVGLTAVAATTSTLRLMTYLTIVPYRNPFMLAKSVASLDALSGGRVVLGVGTGYLTQEFEALGVDFGERNARFDEYLEVLKLAWTGEPVTYAGRFVTANGVTSVPTPATRPHPPVWLGGNSPLTRRRVAAAGQGWMPMPVSQKFSKRVRSTPLEGIDELATMIGEVRDGMRDAGRTDPLDVMYVLPGRHGESEDAAVDRYREMAGPLAEIGVTWLAVNGRGETVAEARDFIGRFADRVLAKV